MNPVEHDVQKMFEKLPGGSSVGLVRELHHRKLACPVYGDEKMQLAFAFSGLDLDDIKVEEPDQVAFEKRWRFGLSPSMSGRCKIP